MGLVLIVEDEPSNAALAAAVLNRAGHCTVTAADGAAALDIAHRRLPDLVLLDVSLAGGMSGLDVCRALRLQPHRPRRAAFGEQGGP